MGTHAGYFIKTKEDEPLIVLYQHFDGYDWKEQLAIALTKAKSRVGMGDSTYATRIIISQLIGDQWDSELGFGMYLDTENGTQDYEYSCVIDLIEKRVRDSRENVWVPFDTFIQLYTPVTV